MANAVQETGITHHTAAAMALIRLAGAALQVLLRLALSFREPIHKEKKIMHTFRRFIASFLIVCLSSLGFTLNANAAIVTTQEATASLEASAERDRVSGFLAREDVRQALTDQGVDPQAAMDRVKSMSDAEVAQLAGRIDQLPAGGDVVGVLLTIFVVLLITDIIGFTKVFPFTRSIR